MAFRRSYKRSSAYLVPIKAILNKAEFNDRPAFKDRCLLNKKASFKTGLFALFMDFKEMT